MRLKLIVVSIILLLPSLVFAGSIIASQSTTSDWGSGFCENISLKNTGNTEASWSELYFTLNNSIITSLWNGGLTVSNWSYTVKPVSWNNKIAAGSAVDIGYCASWSGRPTNLSVSDGIIIPPPPTTRPTSITLSRDWLSLSSTVTSDWNTGYCRSVILKNTTSTQITNWNISFDNSSDISLWSAKKTRNGNIFTISPESWNAKLGQAEFGFCVSSDSVDSNWQITLVEIGIITPPPTPVNWVCGSDNNKTLSYPPTNLCSAGIASSLSGTGPWNWSCQGINGGTNMSCQAEKSTIILPPPVVGSGIVMGYYPSWARYSYTYDKIDYSKFDIIDHAFVFPSETTGIKVDADFLYPELVSRVHENGKKILVTVGNIWGDPVFWAVMSDPTKRQRFITTLTKFIADNNYDGVDIDWEFPNDAKEWTQFLDLIRDLKTALPWKLVTVAISVLPHDFDLATLSSYADYINIMTYDMEAWYSYAGYNSPLYHNSNMPIDVSIDHYMRTTFAAPWINQKKLILWVPLYGRKFSVQNPYMPAYGSTAIEYKDLPKDCTRKWDNESLVPYLSCSGFYITYDDAESLRHKREYANTMKLGGIFFWALGQDNGAIIASIWSSPVPTQSTTQKSTQLPTPKTPVFIPKKTSPTVNNLVQNTKKTSIAKKSSPRVIVRKIYRKR